MDELRPGPTGEPLPPGEWVLRLAILSKDFQETGTVSAEAFALSSEDRKDSPPRLSVWAERRTSAQQAWVLAGEKPNYRLMLRLNVDAIRSLRPVPDSPDVPDLDVQWHTLLTEEGVADARPGADGHAGIAGLDSGTPGQRKSLRRKLARLASTDARVLWNDSTGSGAQQG